MKDYRLEIKVRNNLLLSKIEEAGYTSVNRFAEDNGLAQTNLSALVSLKISPLKETGELRDVTSKLLEIFSCSLEDLFSPNQLFALDKNKYQFNLSSEEMQKMISSESESPLLEDLIYEEQKIKMINSALNALPRRLSMLLKMSYGFPPYEKSYSLGECAEVFKVSTQRIRQMKAKGMFMMKHRQKELIEFISEEYK